MKRKEGNHKHEGNKLLFYKIQKGTVTTHDYINWSHGLLSNEISSPSLNILSSCPLLIISFK